MHFFFALLNFELGDWIFSCEASAWRCLDVCCSSYIIIPLSFLTHAALAHSRPYVRLFLSMHFIVKHLLFDSIALPVHRVQSLTVRELLTTLFCGQLQRTTITPCKSSENISTTYTTNNVENTLHCILKNCEEMATAMLFGPEWMRTKQSGPTRPPAAPSPPFAAK